MNRSRPGLSRERVLQAALLLADQVGIDSLSMRKLGEALGVQAMSLYKHVSSKEDILDGIIDLVAEEIDLPSTSGDWKASMRRRAISAHGVLLCHPWSTMLMVSRVNVGPAMLRYVEATIGCLRSAGFSYKMADHAWNAIDNHVYGFTLQKLNFPFEPQEYARVAKEYLPRLPEDQYPHLHGMSLEVISGAHDGLTDFEFGLDLVLDGLERLLASNA